MTERFFATCPLGLAEVLAAELGQLGASDIKAMRAGVSFRGDMILAYRANLYSRIATRVLMQIAHFRYRSEHDVYKAANAVIWNKHFGVAKTFKVEVNAHRSPLKSLDFVGLKIKDAIADRFRQAVGSRPDVETREPDIRIHCFLEQAEGDIYIDLSGEPLFKRGEREGVGLAPIKKNLAAGIIKLSGWQPGTPLLDPMCGSGTFLVEAAEIALKRAAGRDRSFAFEHLSNFDAGAWKRLKDLANAAERSINDTALPIFGAELYGRTLSHALRNLEYAGLEQAIELKQSEVLDLAPPTETGTLISNPPYGVRLGDKAELAEFYPLLGNVFKQRFAGWNCYLFTGDPGLAKHIRLSASKRTPLFNGAIECRLFEYKIIAGSNRKEVAKEAINEDKPSDASSTDAS